MSSLLLTAPAVEPLSLAETKDYLRVEHNDDDDLIGALIAASRIHVEAQTRRALITQTWRITLDAWPSEGRLPIRPPLFAGLLLMAGELLLQDTNVSAAIQSVLQPKYVPYYVIAIGLITEMARRRSIGKAE